MNKNLIYLKYIARHKWYVFKACLKYGIVWRGLVHDLSKLFPSEFIPYRDYFYGRYGEVEQNITNDIQEEFDLAWLRHQKKNLHHWQAWVLKQDDGQLKALEMPLEYRQEMLADWSGASIAIKGYDDTYNWYAKNWKNMILAPMTRNWVEHKIGFYT